MHDDLHQRPFVKELDFTPEEFRHLLELSASIKTARREGREEQRLRGKNIAVIFEKTSTRTRCAFEVAAHQQGAHVTYLDPAAPSSGTRSPSRTPHASSAATTTGSNTGAATSAWWRSWPSTPAFRSGTA